MHVACVLMVVWSVPKHAHKCDMLMPNIGVSVYDCALAETDIHVCAQHVMHVYVVYTMHMPHAHHDVTREDDRETSSNGWSAFTSTRSQSDAIALLCVCVCCVGVCVSVASSLS